MIFLLMIDPSIFLNMDGGYIYRRTRPRTIFLRGTIERLHSSRPKKAGYLIYADTIEGFHQARLCNADMRHKPRLPNTPQSVCQPSIFENPQKVYGIPFGMKASLPGWSVAFGYRQKVYGIPFKKPLYYSLRCVYFQFVRRSFTLLIRLSHSLHGAAGARPVFRGGQ